MHILNSITRMDDTFSEKIVYLFYPLGEKNGMI